MTESAHPVLTAVARYRAALLANEDAATRRLVAAYGSAYQRLGVQIAALREILTDEPMTRKRAGDLVQLAALRRQIAEEIGRFGVIADNELAQSSRQAIDLGLQHSLGLAQAYFTSPQGRQALTGAFQMLAPAQVETLVGFLADDSPLRQGLTAQLGPAVAERVSDRLIDGMVRGFNPNKTADIVRKELGVGLAWAINTTRTANLWAYREATRANYAANPRIVSGWIWYATLDGRVCGNCLSQHGSRHPLGETLNGHHQCRCAMLPILPMAANLGISEPEIEPGEKWFNRQDETLQRDILGPGMLAAYKAGAVSFEDFRGHTYEHPAYGTMQRMPSMTQLGLERYYTSAVERSADRRTTTTAAPDPYAISPQKLLGEWVLGSSRKTSILLKEAIRAEMGAPGLVMNRNKYQIRPAEIAGARAAVAAMYERTQAALAGRGTIKLYRGVKTEVRAPGVVESWTTDLKTARKFNGYDVLEMEIPVERIFMYSGGPGWKNGKYGEQYEYMVMASAPRREQ